MNPSPILKQHLRVLSLAYSIDASDDCRWVRVRGFKLPPGYNSNRIDLLIEMPGDYPCSPPGVSRYMYVPASIRFRGKELRDVHEGVTPGWGDWAWFCYERIAWNPCRDDLVGFLEMVRADLTNPPTK